jgi:hypothetical protein
MVKLQEVAVTDGTMLNLKIHFKLEEGWHINEEAPNKWKLTTEHQPLQNFVEASKTSASLNSQTTMVPVKWIGNTNVTLQLNVSFYACSADGEKCMAGDADFEIPIVYQQGEPITTKDILLEHEVVEQLF